MCFEWKKTYKRNYYLDYHFMNERRMYEKNGRFMHPKLFQYLCENKNVKFQRIIINFFFILYLANRYNLNCMNMYEFCEKNPKFLEQTYGCLKLNRNGFSKIERLISCKTYVPEEYTLFENVSITEYKIYMNILFQYYELQDGKIPRILYQYINDSKSLEIQKKFLDWYIPSLESLRGVFFEIKEHFLDKDTTNEFYLPRFYTATNLACLGDLFLDDERTTTK